MVHNRVIRGVPPISGAPNNEIFGKIEGSRQVDQRGAVAVGAGGDTGWDVLGADPKANPRLPVDEKRWFF